MAALCRFCCRRKCFSPTERIFFASGSLWKNSAAVSKKESTSAKAVKIPAYIPRGPTDILKALASTVGRDPTASHYMYHDDPYLLPTNYINKRTFVLSKESGRKAARYFLDNYPADFENDEAVPKIPAFNPPLKLTETSPVTPETLRYLIHSSQVHNAIQAYSNLKQANVSVERETVFELFELLCFHNSQEAPDETYIDTKWVHIEQGGTKKPAWDASGAAEQLFEELEVKDARAYRILIQGMCRYNNYSRALQLYSEMKEKGLEGNTRMYNYLIGIIPEITRNSGARWAKAEEFLQAMVQEELQPDILTFNNLLNLISRMPNWTMNREKARSLLAEMKAIGVEPSLGTFRHLLNIFCQAKGPVSYVLHDILKVVESKSWQVQDPNDMNFFLTAIAVAQSHLVDVEIGHRLYAVLCKDDNIKFLANGHKESLFYTSYMKLLISAADLKEFFEVYERIVPTQYIPETFLMGEMFKAIQDTGQLQLLPKLWSDAIIFQMDIRDEVVGPVLSAIAQGGPQENKALQDQLTTVATSILERIQNIEESARTRITLKGDLLGDLLTSFLNGDSMENAWQVVQYMIQKKNMVAGRLPGEALMAFCKVALESGATERMLTCLGYACNNEVPEAEKFLIENRSNLPQEFLNKYSVLFSDE